MVKAQRGTQDIRNQDARLWQHIEDTAARVFHAAKCQELRTPIFESTELFCRAVGEGTDIVNKEMYSFEDKGGRSITLRPEGTAGVVRAGICLNFQPDAGTGAVAVGHHIADVLQ